MKILLAADGSDFTRPALDLLARLPFPEGSALTIVTVAPALESTGHDDDVAEFDAVRQDVLDDADQVLTDAEARAARLGLPLSRTVRTGDVADELIRCADEMDADLVVVGSHGRHAITRFLLGSVSHNVVTYAPRSVLLSRPNTRPVDEQSPDDDTSRPMRVLIATDGSEPSRKAIAQLATLSRKPWCDVRILTVLELIMAYRMDIRQRMTESWKREKALAEAHLEEASKSLSPIATSIRTDLMEESSASETILNAADDFDADLIVVGGTGKGGAERVLLGSVSNRIVNHAACSVWIAH